MLCKDDDELTQDELLCIRELRERLKNLDLTSRWPFCRGGEYPAMSFARYVTHDWLKLAWSRNLDVDKAEALVGIVFARV